jgi:AcrR family transcriptional regulator
VTTGRRQGRGRRPRGYHHGDLKAALVEAAADILHRQGLAALTLRAVARATGVSQAAPYRHFPDRRALVAAVAERGFRRLQSAMLERMGSVQGRLGFKHIAIAYVEFALANPAEYRVMFGAELANTDDLPALRETARSVLGFVAEGIRKLQAAGHVSAGDPWLMAVTAWSMLHGLVMLTLDGQTAGITPGVDALVDEAARVIMFGLAGPARP